MRTKLAKPVLSFDKVAQAPLTVLTSVGAVVAEKCAARGLHIVQDLWLFFPIRYEDRTHLTPLCDLQPHVASCIEGSIVSVERVGRWRPMLRITVRDASNARVALCFFQYHTAQIKQFTVGGRIRAYGTPRQGNLCIEMAHPSYQLLAADVIAPLSSQLDPVYPTIEGMRPHTVRKVVQEALKLLPPNTALELLPQAVLQDMDLPDLRGAIVFLHNPPPETTFSQLQTGTHPAQQRLVLEELLAHYLSVRRKRLQMQQCKAPVLAVPCVLADQLEKKLPFRLTEAQSRVLAEIQCDMYRETPMLRLLQGDVGSGKTIVAALAALCAIEKKMQVALAAPTELLAQQHFVNFERWFSKLGIRVEWLAGKITGKRRASILAALAEGELLILIGTHALMQSTVHFQNLALVIVDEQHRFGVHQRMALRDKGVDHAQVPHQLVMTATPIPRTLAMTAYADLDVSVIDALPPGRSPVQTVILNMTRRDELIERIHHACLQGQQIYWVCALIEETEASTAEKIEKNVAQAAEATFALLCKKLPNTKIGLVHGRMKSKEKHSVMQSFTDGEITLLVATTVIEVGVDVPNASLMVIENAERFGLAQLHQLRGRVGRGAAVSTCVLLYQAPLSQIAKNRLEVMRQSNDGFVIAEKDLELRGPGELLGTRQTGVATFRVADLSRDAKWLPKVQILADIVMTQSPSIADKLIDRWIGQAIQYASA